MIPDTLKAIRTRRVVRHFTGSPVSEEAIHTIVEVARWALAAFNRRVQHYVCLTERELIEDVRLVAPRMGDLPAALIVICVDWEKAGYYVTDRTFRNTYIDVRTAAENMLLAAHALGLGGWPMTSLSPAAGSVLLNLPERLQPEMFIGVGHPDELPSSAMKRPKRRIRIDDLVQWGPFPEGYKV